MTDDDLNAAERVLDEFIDRLNNTESTYTEQVQWHVAMGARQMIYKEKLARLGVNA